MALICLQNWPTSPHLLLPVGDLSSISGSESSSEDEQEGVELKLPGHAHNASPRSGVQKKSQYLHFSPADAVGGASPTHSIYRCIVAGSGTELGSEVILDALRGLKEARVWIILMRSGGHFAGAVFRG